MMLLVQVIYYDEIMSQPVIVKYRKVEKKNTLFLDRDGVLNEVVMRGNEISSPRNIDEIVIAKDLIYLGEQKIIENWNLILISNQPDLSRGLISKKFIELVNEKIMRFAPINAAYICPHVREDICKCRKPKIGLLDRYNEDFPYVKGKSYMIGDRKADQLFAKNGGIDFILKKQPHNFNLFEKLPNAINNFSELNNFLR